MPFREVRDEEGRVILLFDPERDRIRYKDERGEVKEQGLAPYRGPRGQRDVISRPPWKRGGRTA